MTQSLFADVSVLRATIQGLRRREIQLLKYKEQSEIEFGQRRAKFKELYMAREGETRLAYCPCIELTD